MSKECKTIQGNLIDVFYQERPIDKEIEVHLKSCRECSSHWESLHDIKREFSILDADAVVDLQGIRQAFQTVEDREKKQKSRIDYIIFLLVICVLMSLLVVIATLGYGMAVIIGQVSFAVLTPLLIPLMFVRKLRREGA